METNSSSYNQEFYPSFKRIIVLDDDLYSASRLQNLLIEIGHSQNDISIQTKPLELLTSKLYLDSDLILIDVEMPIVSGFDFISSARSHGYLGTFICISAFDKHILQALRSRMIDFLLKPVDEDELKLSLMRAASIIHETSQHKRITASCLSKREKEVLQLVLSGSNSKDIAKRLCLSKHTIDTHRRNILRKTGCSSAIELIQQFKD